ncbi:MAG TPA: hypothetical protein PLP01_03950 [Phycisphaerae bacterium]|nr:hypothetical protein [Phycisphaerae bacterium]HOI54379.1 hypothetical protein [Phycisphaerae bacterium]
MDDQNRDQAGCPCHQYGALELQREAITRRAGEYKKIATRLVVLGKHPDGEHVLMKCPVCNQCWQRSSAWNWGAKPYLFGVPAIELSDWLELPFVDPDEVLIFAASIDRFLTIQKFVASTNSCRKEGCSKHAIKGSVFCLKHHVESLQRIHTLPQTPSGRWWGPYERFNPDRFDDVLEKQQP